MTTILFYEKPGCANNSRQKLLLKSAGHDIVARNLLTEAWTAERLRRFFDDLPVAEWFNRAAPRVKSGEIVPDAVTASDALALMLADPLLIRRPLMECNGKTMAGFDAARVEEWLGAALGPNADKDLQTCQRNPAYGAASDQ